MYPENELNRLSAYKAALRRDIARRRVRCAGDTARVLRPLAWADRVVAFLRKLRPLAAVAAAPVISLVMRRVFSGRTLLGSLVRWSPLIFGALSVLKRDTRPSAEATRVEVVFARNRQARTVAR